MNLSIQWPLVLFSLIAGTGGALYAFSVLPLALGQQLPQGAFAAAIAAMVLIVVGGLCSVAHLKQLGNSLHAIGHLLSFSGISIELVLLGATFVAVLANTIMASLAADAVAQQVVAVVGIVFSLLLGFYCGHGYVMPGRPEWQTNFLPLAYLGTSLCAGCSLFLVIEFFCGDVAGQMAFYAPWYVGATAVCALTCAAYSVRVRPAVLNAGQAAVNIQADIDRSAEKSRVERAKKIFAVGLVACGIPVTLLCGVLTLVLSDAALIACCVAVACVASIVAGLSVRTLMWEVGRCYLPLFDLCDIGITV